MCFKRCSVVAVEQIVGACCAMIQLGRTGQSVTAKRCGKLKGVPPGMSLLARSMRSIRHVTEGGDDAMRNHSKGFTAAQKVQIVVAVSPVLTAMIATFGPVLITSLL